MDWACGTKVLHRLASAHYPRGLLWKFPFGLDQLSFSRDSPLFASTFDSGPIATSFYLFLSCNSAWLIHLANTPTITPLVFTVCGRRIQLLCSYQRASERRIGVTVLFPEKPARFLLYFLFVLPRKFGSVSDKASGAFLSASLFCMGPAFDSPILLPLLLFTLLSHV